MILCFDIETVEHPDNPAKPSVDAGDKVPAAPHLRIVAATGIALRPMREPVRWYSAEQAVVFGGVGASEREIVTHFVTAMARKPKLVSYNGGPFDLRVIVAGMMEHGIQCPYLFSRDVTYRYSTDGHEDIQDSLSNFGRGRFGGQDAWVRRIGLPGKMGVDGSQAAALHGEGRIQDLTDYCMCDSGQLAGLFLRKELVAGGLCLDGYRRSVGSLVELFERTPALRAIVEHERFDRKRFLMEEV
jgi:predicted PolB exonuclease-like 3'-5' exonuclease